ncbi:MAG: DUF1801 domain-containing protein [Verrucomicrobiales bacterium]|jgi:uncharacterized protein YdeI (YjbR/CyaY-like superfamily)|nr:DUF1801 domain-containing protein [Verrucomicrobiales bacterium]
MNSMNPKVDAYLSETPKWREELQALRKIILGCGLAEELKWDAPCYTLQGSNLVMLGALKDYCALAFLKGVLLKDPKGILTAPGKNSQSVRQARFTSLREITALKPVLKAYIREAVGAEQAGLKVEFKKHSELDFVQELRDKLAEDKTFKTAFTALTPGRQRAYNLYFSAPKQAKTRQSRIEQHTPRILKGLGINDCTCGLTKRPPSCDGSHKQLSGKMSKSGL